MRWMIERTKGQKCRFGYTDSKTLITKDKQQDRREEHMKPDLQNIQLAS
jgi:hypothetical protein